MTILQLQYAVAIADVGSMNRAAELLYVSQPTLSNAIRELEKEVGIAIFTRTNRGVTLTKDGLDFLHYARQVCQQYDLLEKHYIEKRSHKRKFAISTQHYSFVIKAFVETVKHFDLVHFDFAVRETRTMEVIRDVSEQRSSLGILFCSDYNRDVIFKLLAENDLEFHPLLQCNAYVYLWKGHPLARNASITFEELEPYPCLCFEQGSQSSSFFAEEILSEKEHLRLVRVTDRATMLNLMVGIHGYTLCSGIICEELNGTDFIAVPYQEDEANRNSVMEIGYIQKQGCVTDEIGTLFLQEVCNYLKTNGGLAANSPDPLQSGSPPV